MKAFLLAVLAAVAIALGASMVLDGWQEPSSHALATSGVRLGDGG